MADCAVCVPAIAISAPEPVDAVMLWAAAVGGLGVLSNRVDVRSAESAESVSWDAEGLWCR